MEIVFSPHAEEKLELLKIRGFPISKEQVIDCVTKPDRMDDGYSGRKVAQKRIDDHHVVRVVLEVSGEMSRIVTVYPGKVD